MADLTTLAAAARAAVTQAAGVCREIQANIDELKSMTKDDASPVTVGDFASQAVIVHMLRNHLGDSFRLIAEEDPTTIADAAHAHHLEACLAAVRGVWPGCTVEALLEAVQHGSNHRHHRDRSGAPPETHGAWTLDPIDGTKGFLRGQQYSIALAYIEHGDPVVAALACPNLALNFSKPLEENDERGSLYVALRGDGVEEYACVPDASGTTLRRAEHDESAPITVCGSVEHNHSDHTATDQVLDELERRGTKVGERARTDSQVKYAVTARGQADIYLRLPAQRGYREKIWDHAAGALVAEEAGCQVTDALGRTLDFSVGDALERNRGIACAPPLLHGKLRDALDVVGKPSPE